MDIAAGRRIGHLARLDQVYGSNLDGAQIEFLGDAIHHPLPDEAHARLADPPIRDDRTLVGHDGIAFEQDVFYLVSIREVIQFVGEVDRESADGAADVVDLFKLQSQDRAVFFDSSLDVKLLGARMARGHHVLAAIFDPLDRPSGFDGQEADYDDVLAYQVDLLTEAAADVRNDDPDIL